MTQRRTDLAVEAHQLWQESAEGRAASALPGVQAQEGEQEGFSVTTVTISTPEAAKTLGKPEGVYVTVELDALLRREEDAFQRAALAVSTLLKPLLPPSGTALVVGLGNRAVTPDLIGPLTTDHMLVTRHLVEQAADHFGHLRPVASVAPGVLASTGIESGLVAAALSQQLKPSCVIAVDALDRLCRTIQLSNTGIIPGSGVGNHRSSLDQNSLGVPVFSVGAPTVVNGATLTLDLLEQAGAPAPEQDTLTRGQDLFVTPRDIDSKVADISKVLGYGISLALNPSLTIEDLVMLLE